MSKHPAPNDLLSNAIALHQQGQIEQAKAYYGEVLRRAPRNAEALHLLGMAEHQSRNPERALDLVRRAIKLAPANPAYHANLAVILLNQGELKAASEACERAIGLKSDYAEALNNLGLIRREQERHEDAAACFAKAIEINPEKPGMHINLGNAYKELKLFPDAIAAYLGALDIKPDSVEAHLSLANAYKENNERAKALEHYFKARELRPQFIGAHSDLASVLAEFGRVDEGLDSYRKALAIAPGHVPLYSGLLFVMNYSSAVPTETLIETSLAHPGNALTPAVIEPYGNDRDPDRPLRIGMVSGDLKSHPVSQFLKTMLPEVDQDQYTLYAYATSRTKDPVTAEMHKVFSHWRHVPSFDDDKLVAQIRSDEIDVVVDLSGHTGENRLTMFAKKPAPVSVTWLGYSGTTGVKAIDYILADRWVAPEGSDWQFAEQPYRLPDSYLCFSPPSLEVPVEPLAALSNGYVTFGCFNNLNKVSDATIACWADVLRAVPTSKLLLKSGPLRDETLKARTLERFAEQGIGAERLELMTSVSDSAGHLATYNRVDIALDPFPYNGTTTTAEALWMGVPVLTLAGDRFIARVGVSLVETMGMGDWVATDTGDYVAKAVQFAADVEGLAGIKAGIRARFLASPLCDAPRFARNLEGAFRHMWRDWCAQG